MRSKLNLVLICLLYPLLSGHLSAGEVVNTGLRVEVLDLAQTRDGVLWIATPEGLKAYDGDERDGSSPDLAPQALVPLQPFDVTAVVPDPTGYFWAGTREDGLFRFDGRLLTPISRPNRLGGGWEISTLFQDSTGILWIGTPSDLLQIEGLATSSLHGLPGVDVQSITEDLYGNVWVSVGSNLFRRIQEIFQSISIPLSVESSHIFDLVMAPDGALWLAREKDLLRLQGNLDKGGLPQTYETVEGLPAGSARHLVSGADVFWIGTKNGELYEWSEEDGLSRVPIEKELPEITDLLLGSFGELWIGTRGGLYRLNPEPTHSTPPHARISTISVAGETHIFPLQTSRRWTLTPASPDPVLTLDSAASGFGRPTYRLRLGRDEEWRAIDSNQAFLADLRPGTYDIEVQASLDGDTWGPKATLELTRGARWYQRSEIWVWTASAGFGLTFLFFLRAAYIRRLQMLHELHIASEIEALGDSPRLEESRSQPLRPGAGTGGGES